MVNCVSIMKLWTCFSALLSSSFRAMTATTSAVHPAPYNTHSSTSLWNGTTNREKRTTSALITTNRCNVRNRFGNRLHKKKYVGRFINFPILFFWACQNFLNIFSRNQWLLNSLLRKRRFLHLIPALQNRKHFRKVFKYRKGTFNFKCKNGSLSSYPNRST